MTIDDSLREKLENFAIFDGLSPEELGDVMLCGRQSHFKAGEMIIEESSESWDLYVVLSGRISIEMAVRGNSPQSQRSKQIAMFRKGEVFGDMAFLRGARRSASVTTVDDFSAIVFDRDRLYGLFDENNRIGYIMVRNLARIMSDRLMGLNLMLRDC